MGISVRVNSIQSSSGNGYRRRFTEVSWKPLDPKERYHAHSTSLHQSPARIRSPPSSSLPRDSRIVNPDGTVVFEMKDMQVPEAWSQVAVDILAQKYFRKAGVPVTIETSRRSRACPTGCSAAGPPPDSQHGGREPTPARSSAAWPAAGPTGAGRAATSRPRPTPAPSSTRPATCWPPRWPRRTARSGSTPACTGPTASKARRRAIISSIRTPAQMTRSTSAYERPAPHACFIQSISDDLVNEGGIMDLWVREARIFKYGSGTGSQFLQPPRRRRTALRRRQIVSGLMSFLKIGDRAAGAIKSRRHHPPRRQDGRARSRSSRHRGVHQLEGRRGAEGRRPGDRLASC